MEATIEAPAKAKPGCKPGNKRINYALAATLLHQGVTLDKIALQVGAANAESLRCGLSRKGVTLKSIRNAPVADERVTSVTARIASQAAESLRDSLGNQLGVAVQAMNGKRISYRDLANAGQGHAAVLKTLAETHRTLYGGAEMNVLIFGADSMGRGPIQQQSQAPEHNSQGVIDLPASE